MRDLVLVLPDLTLHDGATGTARAAALTRLRFAQASLLRGGWRGLLARGMGRPDLMAVDPAEVVSAAMADPDAAAAAPDAPRDPWLVAPLHLVAGLTTVHLTPGGLLRLPPDEAQELAAAYRHVFGGEGLSLRPAGGAGFLLEGLAAAIGAVAVEPQRLLAGTLDDALPGGPGGPALRAWIAETEMWLHGLPLNRRREVRGEPRVTTLWPWGGGNPLREPLQVLPEAGAPQAARWPRVWSDDAWVAALGRLAALRVEPLPAADAFETLLAVPEDAGCAVVPVAPEGLEALDQAFIAPAARALQQGRLERLTVAAEDRAVRVAGTDRWRIWRPRRDLLTAVAEGGA